MDKFYAIMLNFAGNPRDYHDKIERALDPVVDDWLRFADFQYIVKSKLMAQFISAPILKVIPQGGYAVVIELNLLNRHGFASNLVVEWIKKHSP